MIQIRSKGDFKNTNKLLKKMLRPNFKSILDKYGRQGVEALASATPINTGKTAESWYYTITSDENAVSVTWYNSNVNNGVNIAIILEYGHATGTGGYVAGLDYINPTLIPIFEKIVNDAWFDIIK